MQCPRRGENFGQQIPGLPTEDEWQDRHGVRSCSYCGSMHPDDFMAEAVAGTEIGPTDKSYKAYVGSSGRKFYFQHLSTEQKIAFVDLWNDRKMKVGYPGHFYMLPFFMKLRD